MPVVSRDDPRSLVGYLGRTGIMEARARQLQDENLREQSWGFGRQISAKTVSDERPR
jgi:hypothetical protein